MTGWDFFGLMSVVVLTAAYIAGWIHIIRHW